MMKMSKIGILIFLLFVGGVGGAVGAAVLTVMMAPPSAATVMISPRAVLYGIGLGMVFMFFIWAIQMKDWAKNEKLGF